MAKSNPLLKQGADSLWLPNGFSAPKKSSLPCSCYALTMKSPLWAPHLWGTWFVAVAMPFSQETSTKICSPLIANQRQTKTNKFTRAQFSKPMHLLGLLTGSWMIQRQLYHQTLTAEWVAQKATSEHHTSTTQASSHSLTPIDSGMWILGPQLVALLGRRRRKCLWWRKCVTEGGFWELQDMPFLVYSLCLQL